MAKSDAVMTIEELSKYLKISRSTLYKLAQEGKLPAQKVGRHWRFHRAAVDRWLVSCSPKMSPPDDIGWRPGKGPDEEAIQ